MILFALAAAVLGPPGAIDVSNARTIYTGSVDPEGRAISPDCEEWMNARQERGGRAAELQAWMAGVITGYNLYHPSEQKDALNLLEGKTLSDAYKWIDERCANAPEAALPNVALDLVEEWRKR